MQEIENIEKDSSLAMFNNVPVRRHWDAEKERWFFAVVDIIEVLTDSPRPRKYWNALKTKITKEGSELSQKLGQLKMRAKDGKMYKTDVADTETVFRLVQSVPSPKAEPFKQWLAKVGYERLQETVDPELAVNRARDNWKKSGRSEKWIEQRMRGTETRNKLTDYWKDSGVKEGVEFAKLTNIIHQEWSGLTTQQHKRVKDLKSQSLRDNMTEAELIFTALAELSTTQIAKAKEAKGYWDNANAAQQGGSIAGSARKQLEEKTGKKVISSENFLPPKKEQKKLK